MIKKIKSKLYAWVCRYTGKKISQKELNILNLSFNIFRRPAKQKEFSSFALISFRRVIKVLVNPYGRANLTQSSSWNVQTSIYLWSRSGASSTPIYKTRLETSICTGLKIGQEYPVSCKCCFNYFWKVSEMLF